MGLGRIIGKAAKGAAPVALQKWRDDADAKQLQTLQKYQQGVVQQQQDFQASQNQLTREQDQTQFAATKELEQARLDLQKGQSLLQAKQVNSALDAAEQAAQVTDFEIERQQQLKDLRASAIAAATPEEQDEALRQYQIALTGKPEQEKYSFGTAYGDENEFGVQTRQSGSFNASTGKFTPILPGAGGSQPSLEDMDADLLADPTPANIKAYDDIRGMPGAAQKLIQSKVTPTPPITAPAKLPAGGGVTKTNTTPTATPTPKTDSSVLDGWKRPTNATRQTQSSNQSRQQPRVKADEGQMAASEINKIMATNTLPNLATPGMLAKVQAALASGKLSDEYVKVLQAYLNEK